MDDYEPWLTPCDPDFDPEKCESAYALWAVKEEGEPVKFRGFGSLCDKGLA